MAVTGPPDHRDPRWATAHDDARLRRFVGSVPIHGQVSYCLEREPDYFRLLRLQGDPARAALIEANGEIVAMAACAVQALSFSGRMERVLYTCDARVHPAHRGQGLFRAIVELTLSEIDAMGAVAAYTLILKGNRAMQPMIATGVAGMRFHPLATIRNFTLFRGNQRRIPAGTAVRCASMADLPAMVWLWNQQDGQRDLRPGLTVEGLRGKFARMPGFGIESFRIVERGGEVTGFAAAWDPHPLKQVRLLDLSTPLRMVRGLYNPLARAMRRAPLPRFGEHLRFAYVTHLCASRAQDVQALLARFDNELRGTPFMYLDLALDVRDPHMQALRGIARSSLDFELFLITWEGGARATALPPDRPFFFEMALV